MRTLSKRQKRALKAWFDENNGSGCYITPFYIDAGALPTEVYEKVVSMG
ncbi:unnamed protein product, partial [marine sediment metagenome]